MLQKVEKVKEGFEKIYADTLEYEKIIEEKIRLKMADELDRIKAVKNQCVEIVEIEVQDEEQQSSAEEII